ncbi:MAG: 23S rRNA (uracil(1939)-C(5))-methyltransferase RlmD [Oscillospiraceae bacterium]|nr:23S rRNA (uracil(1939)-C(5))-methyltransferase RlmD [Oscillospiraceae bacterium]
MKGRCEPDRALEGSVHTLAIAHYASDGAGVARLNGAAVFVEGGLAGERCQVQIDKAGRSCLWGHVTQIEQPSPCRLTPDCPYFGRCGGCRLRHMDYTEECSYKRARVEEALHRIGGLSLPVSVIHGAAQISRYRNKVQFPVSAGPAIGFYQARTHRVVDVEDCLLQPKEAASLRGAVKQWMLRFQVPSYDERTGTGLIRHVYVRFNRAGQSLCCLMVNGTRVPHGPELVNLLRAADPKLTGVVLGIHQKRNNVILGDAYRTLWGEDVLQDTLCGLILQLAVPSFYQVNPDQTEILYRRALDLAGLTGQETVLDLYCGIGTISLVMAQSAAQVFGVEVVPQAVEDARQNAARNGCSNAQFLCADAGQAAQTLARQGIRPHVVCVDPPRKGLAPDVIQTIAQMAPDRIVYVSCDPATLARDLKHFASLGYQPQIAEAVDLFPRTAHVETVALLSRSRAI